jgi:hypothetical protein
MPASLPKGLISFSFLIDLKEMPIEEYNRQLLPESKSTQMGNPAWMIYKYAMSWPCCNLFSFKTLYYLSKRFYLFWTLVLFFWDYFIALLFHFMALYFIHGALFHFIFWQRAFVQVFLSARKRFIIALYSNFSKCRKALCHSAFTQFFLSASKCLFFILNASASILISDVKRLISWSCFEISWYFCMF